MPQWIRSNAKPIVPSSSNNNGYVVAKSVQAQEHLRITSGFSLPPKPGFVPRMVAHRLGSLVALTWHPLSTEEFDESVLIHDAKTLASVWLTCLEGQILDISFAASFHPIRLGCLDETGTFVIGDIHRPLAPNAKSLIFQLVARIDYPIVAPLIHRKLHWIPSLARNPSNQEPKAQGTLASNVVVVVNNSALDVWFLGDLVKSNLGQSWDVAKLDKYHLHLAWSLFPRSVQLSSDGQLLAVNIGLEDVEIYGLVTNEAGLPSHLKFRTRWRVTKDRPELALSGLWFINNFSPTQSSTHMWSHALVGFNANTQIDLGTCAEAWSLTSMITLPPNADGYQVTLSSEGDRLIFYDPEDPTLIIVFLEEDKLTSMRLQATYKVALERPFQALILQEFGEDTSNLRLVGVCHQKIVVGVFSQTTSSNPGYTRKPRDQIKDGRGTLPVIPKSKAFIKGEDDQLTSDKDKSIQTTRNTIHAHAKETIQTRSRALQSAQLEIQGALDEDLKSIQESIASDLSSLLGQLNHGLNRTFSKSLDKLLSKILNSRKANQVDKATETLNTRSIDLAKKNITMFREHLAHQRHLEALKMVTENECFALRGCLEMGITKLMQQRQLDAHGEMLLKVAKVTFDQFDSFPLVVTEILEEIFFVISRNVDLVSQKHLNEVIRVSLSTSEVFLTNNPMYHGDRVVQRMRVLAQSLIR